MEITKILLKEERRKFTVSTWKGLKTEIDSVLMRFYRV